MNVKLFFQIGSILAGGLLAGLLRAQGFSVLAATLTILAIGLIALGAAVSVR